jgi:hypothetical protein
MFGSKNSPNQKYTVSFFSQVALVGASMLYLYSTTFDPAQVSHFFTMILILVMGIVLAVTMVGVKFVGFNAKTLLTDAIATTVCVVSIVMVNRLVNINLGISPIGELAFGILAGVAEEWFFRLFLCAWVYKVTRSMLVAVPVSAMVWAVFHIARYGASMDTLWLVFFAGLPLGAVTLMFRSADGPTFGHMIVNALVR